MIDFKVKNTDIKDFLNKDGIQGLENISEYINYGIHSTIINQFGNIVQELENQYAIKILNSFIDGKDNAFTSSKYIRKNITSIDKFKITILLIRSTIERYAFNVVEKRQRTFENDEDKVSQTITELVANGDLNDVLTWIKSDHRIIQMLIENYVALSYQSDKKLRDIYTKITISHPKTNKALEQLNLELKSIKEKQI